MKKIFFFLAALAVAFTANAKVTTISPDAENDALRLAVHYAEDGDIIEMTEGTYVQCNNGYVAFDGKSVTVKAAEGANVVLQLQVPITLANGGKATLQGIKIDASRLLEKASWYEHVIYANDATEGKQLVMDGCELYGFGLNKSAIYSSSSNTLALCDVKNCYFHDNMKSCFFFEGASIAELSVVNSTFANIATNAESYYAGIIDPRNPDAKVTVDHCTFYNCLSMSTSYAAVTIKGLKKENVVISNNIFMLPEATDGQRAIRENVEATNCMTFNYVKDDGGIYSTVTQTNCFPNVDPKFVDAANGNYTFTAGSPALGAGTNGTNLGDPRWNPSEGSDDNTGDEEEGGDDAEEEDTTVKIYVSPSGDDDYDGKTPETAKATLKKAYAVANAGETIIVANGEYESSSITFDKPGVTVKAAKDTKPVINATSYMNIYATTTFVGLTFDGLGSAEHGFAVKENTAKNLILQDCEVRNYLKNLVFVDGTHHVDSLIIDNCLLHHSGRVAVYVAASSLMDGETPIHGCDYFQLTNSTVYEINSTDYSAGAIDIRTNGDKQGMYTEIIVDHVTIYNAKSSGDYGAIASYKSENVKISNTIVMNDAEYTHYSFRVYGASQVSNCLSYNCSGKSGAQYANCLPDNTDPKFADAANGDFTLTEGSPALTAGNDGKAIGDPRWVNTGDDDNTGDDNTGDDNTGDDEDGEEDTTIDFESRVKVYVSPTGSGSQDGSSPENAKSSFASAYSAVQPGQAIVMADGIYEEAYVITMDKEDVIVKAAEGAKPIIQLTGKNTTLSLAATTTFDGITFDGSGIAYYLVTISGGNGGKFTFKDCEFTNWNSYWAISNQWASGTHIESIVIDSCTFHDATGAPIHFNGSAPSGKQTVDNATITNSTFYNLSVADWVGMIHFDSNIGASQPNQVTIDHITLYNYKTSELGGIVTGANTNLKLTNSIIANTAENAHRFGFVYGNSTIDHNLLFNATKDSGTHTNVITGDPMFVYPSQGNFNLRPGSPALGAGIGGTDLGDQRWGEAEKVVVTGVALSTDSLHIYTTDTIVLEAIISPIEATNRNVTWTIVDPTLASVDNGTIIGLKPGETTITVTTEEGGFTATAKLVIEQKQFHPLVIEADNMYTAEDYTVPSYIQMLVAKEAARRDSTAANVAALQAKIDALQPYQAPYDVVVNINGDPRTNMAFAWFTNETMTEEGVVQLVAKANATEADFADAIEVEAVTESTGELPYIVDDSGIEWKAKLPKDIAHTYISHKAIATGLTPNTTYTYRVGVDGYWSEMGTFITAPQKTNEFSFIYMSDSHIESQAYIDDANSAARAALNTAPDAKFCAFPGDFVENYCNSEWEWERLFEEALRPMAYQMPIVPTDGNHDVHYNPNYSYHFNTDNSFKTHASVKPYADGTTYSFMYGDVLFLVFSMQDYWRGTYSHNTLTSVYLQNDVANWFKEQVAAHPEAKLRVGLVHYNIFSGSSHQDDEMGPLLRATLLPVIKECEIDFVIQGHDHCYEVMGPVDADTRKPILEDIADREVVSTSVSESGYKGGTYIVDRGAMYFIGSTCGHKRYWPYTKEEMEEDFNAHKVENYFDLFTGMFAQPGKPSFSVFTVTDRTITVESYTANPDGSSELFNTFKVQRTKAHTGESNPPTSLEQLHDALQNSTTTKVLHNGQVLIVREGAVYTLFGQQVK